MSLRPGKDALAVRTDPTQGPIFGDDDIHITNETSADTSYSDLGNSYILPFGASAGRIRARNLLTGSYHFSPDDMEVFRYYGKNQTLYFSSLVLNASGIARDYYCSFSIIT